MCSVSTRDQYQWHSVDLAAAHPGGLFGKRKMFLFFCYFVCFLIFIIFYCWLCIIPLRCFVTKCSRWPKEPLPGAKSCQTVCRVCDWRNVGYDWRNVGWRTWCLCHQDCRRFLRDRIRHNPTHDFISVLEKTPIRGPGSVPLSSDLTYFIQKF